MTIYVHNAGKHNATRVPVDRHKPGYWTSFFAEERRQALASSAQFVSDEEWRELAEGINAAIKAYVPPIQQALLLRSVLLALLLRLLMSISRLGERRHSQIAGGPPTG